MTVLISIAQYLIDKDEHFTLYKVSQTYKYTQKPKKIIFNIPCTHTNTCTWTHIHKHTQHRHTPVHAHKYAGVQREDCKGDERRFGGAGGRKKTEF